MSPKNQNPRFLDLEAGDDSDEGLSELAQNSGNEEICDEETDEESDSEEERPSARVRWNEDIEGIEKRFTNRDRLEVGTNDKVDLPEESLIPDRVPAERWPVWEVKCQKGAESEVVRSLYQSFDVVNPPDLRSAFYASSLSSRIYLEARAMGPGTPVYKTLLNTPFVRKQMNSSGSLQVKSWRPVSFEVASHCLAIRSLELAGGTGSLEGSTFAKYDWVTIRQGRYKGDPALVLRDFETPVYWDKRSGKLVDEQWLGSSAIDSTHLEFHLQRQVQVLLIPRLELTSSDSDDGGKGPRLKRKAAPVGRPDPALFAFTQLIGVSPHSQRESAEKTYTHRGRKYQHGLLYQTFSPSKLQKGAHLSAATIRLFQTSNHPVVKQARFPSQWNRNIWHFQIGDCVEMLTSSETGQKQGHENAEVLSTTDWRSGGTIRDIKDDFCEVEFTKGETYYVPCSSLVKVFALGDYVEVMGGAYKGRSGFVVSVDRAKLTLSDIVGSNLQVTFSEVHPNSAIASVPSFFSQKKTDSSWKGCWVEAFGVSEQYGRVIDMARDETGISESGLKVHVHFPSGATKWLDYDDVRTAESSVVLLNAFSVSSNEKKAIYVNPGFTASNKSKTSTNYLPLQWQDKRVTVISGHHKGEFGTVKDVRREDNPSKSISGLVLQVQLETISSYTPNNIIWMDYFSIRDSRNLQAILEAWPISPVQRRYYKVRDDCPPTASLSACTAPPSHSGLWLRPTSPVASGSKTPLTHDLQMSDHDHLLPLNDCWNPGSRTPNPQPLSRPPTPPQDQFPQTPNLWILNPLLAGHEFMVDIMEGEEVLSNVYVKLSKEGCGMTVWQKQHEAWVPVSPHCVKLSSQRPKIATERGLMLVIRGVHTGKFVRRLRHIFTDRAKSHERALLVVAVVTKATPDFAERYTGEDLEMRPYDLTYVRDSQKERSLANAMLDPFRSELKKKYRSAQVRIQGPPSPRS